MQTDSAQPPRRDFLRLGEALQDMHNSKNTRDRKRLRSTNDLPVKPNKHRENDRNRGRKNKARPDDQIGSPSNDDAISGTGSASTLVERMAAYLTPVNARCHSLSSLFSGTCNDY